MELHSVHKTFHHSHLCEEKQEMLNLNRRLESYLNRVKLLEEENTLLAKEIQSLRYKDHGALTRRKGLEEELRKARLEVDAAWRDKIHTELEVGRLAEELQSLDLLRQREVQAHVKAKTMLKQSKKELEEEQRAQIWLREKVSQLEHEMRFLIQTHQEDVAHLETTLAHQRATLPPVAQRGNQTPNLLQLGQEYSQMARRSWQEAAEVHEAQLARLEDSLNQARGRLSQVNQEKSESQLKLQALHKELASAQDIRLHLEKTGAQQRDKQSQEILQLQKHLEGLEVEKEELGQQIDRLLLENRGLQQLKMSLGLEVSTYRALLDSERQRGDTALLNQPGSISISDAMFCPQGAKKSYLPQHPVRHRTASIPSVCSVRTTRPTVVAATPVCNGKPFNETFNETPNISRQPADATKSTTWETPYPKILHDGAVENFRPEEVQEKVTHAEPLSPPNEQEDLATTSPRDKSEENWSNVDDVQTVAESFVSYQVESGLGSEPHFVDEVSYDQFTTSNLSPYKVSVTEKCCVLSDQSDKDVPVEVPAEEEDKQSRDPVDACVEKECIDTKVEHHTHASCDPWLKKEHDKDVEHMQEETSDSDTEAVLEPTLESRTSSPASECEAEIRVFNQFTDFSCDENIANDDVVEMKQEICSTVEVSETNVEDKLYPDGEEMDTWDSVIERKVDLKADDDIKDETKTQHAEPEEDLSAREREERQDMSKDLQDGNVTSSLMDIQLGGDVQETALEQERVLLPDKEDSEEEEEDSQNVSVSWRTEVESDSYAQDNTLADTRPLIRYKSDEVDANTHASHMEESESSEGEQEKKIGETGTWSEGKSKRFGTMEDLCEEAEAEALDEEYDLVYTHTEDRDAGLSMTTHEYEASANDGEDGMEIIKTVSEGRSDEETEELNKPMAATSTNYDEELEIDRLVEQELENLCTDSYSAHFAQTEVSESQEVIHLQDNSVEKTAEQEAAKIDTEDTSCAEPGVSFTDELTSSTLAVDQPYENQYSSDSSVMMPQTDTLADETEHRHGQSEIFLENREQQDDHNVSMVTHADETEFGFGDFISRPDIEDMSNKEDPNSAQQETMQHVAAPAEVKEAAHVDVSSESQELLDEDVADRLSCPDVPETAEWEVLENPSEDFEIKDQDDLKCDNVPESAQTYHHDDKECDEGIVTHKEEPLQISPDCVPEEDIFVVKDSTEELLNKSGKGSDLHDVFSSGIKNDFWASSVETAATYQPEDACNEEQSNQSLGFGDSLVWGNLDNTNVVNGNAMVDTESTKGLAAEEEQGQMHSEIKQVKCRNVVEGEMAHSEESEVEGESWSSGEEPI